ncbi:MAG TPA: protein arginine kinase [Longimicrobiaceae bacterium]|nr:protein arginine kinase [Longimicrobiaceae bacterium]
MRALMHDVVTIRDDGMEWMDSEGPSTDIVLSTRVRLARNLREFRFGLKADPGDRREILARAREAAAATDSLANGRALTMNGLTPAGRRLLLERHVVSKELVGEEGTAPPSDAALLLASGETLGMMVNEEDHLRLQSLVGGFRLRDAWRRVDRLDEELSENLEFAFHPEFGFLTSCPTNVGTGLRASVLVHLPGLVLTQEIARVLQGIAQVGLTFRGLYGEGSEVVGNFFQISNQTTLGKSEEELIDHLQNVVQQVIQYERQARAVLLRDAPTVIEDKVWRAYGLLRYAHSISFEEVMNLLSGVRLGLGLKLIPGVSVLTLNRIMLQAQSAHQEQMAGRALGKNEEDISRAVYLRRMLAREPSSPPEERGNE